MRRAAVVVLLALFVVPGFAAHEEDDAAATKAFHDAIREPSAAERRTALIAIAAEFPKTKVAPRALWYAAREAAGDRDTRAEALPILRRLVSDYPDYAARIERRLGDLLLKAAGWGFSTLPDLVRPGSDGVHRLDRDKGPRRGTYRILRLPPGEVKYASGTPVRMISGYRLPPETTWEECGAQTVEFDSDRPVLRLPNEIGMYVVEENLEGFVHRNLVRVPTFALLAQTVGSELLVWSVDPFSGQSIPGVEVTLIHGKETRKLRTGDDGLLRTSARGSTLIRGRKGAYVDGIPMECDEDSANRYVHVVTDRPIYRPGQTIHFKATRRDFDGGDLTLPEAKPVRVELRGPEGRLFGSRTETWNGNGTITGSFRLASEPPIGTYGILVHVASPIWQDDDWGWSLPEGLEQHWRTTFKVAAYRKPEIRITFARDGPLEDGKIPVVITAEHTSGGVFANAAVDWYATEIWGFLGGASEASELRGDSRWWFFEPEREEYEDGEETGSGDGTTDDKGRLRILLPRSEWATAYEIHAYVTDGSGLESEGVGRIEEDAGLGSVELAVPKVAYRPGEEIVVTARLRAAKGYALAGRTIDYRCFVEDDEPFRSGSVTTGADGGAEIRLKAPDRREVEIQAFRKGDPEERAVVRRVHILGGTPEPEEILILPEKAVYEAGETARLTIRTSVAPLDALLTTEHGAFRDVRMIRIEKAEQILEVPVGRADAPGLRVRVVGVRDGVAASGGFEIPVYPGRAMIDVSVGADREEYRPGDEVTVMIATRDGSGKPLAAEVELAIVDEAVLQLATERAEDLRRFFLGRSRLPLWGDGTLPYFAALTSWIDPWWDAEPAAIFGFEEEADGGGDMAAPDVRSRFADTWHYDARVMTKGDGTATVTLTAPDNLTRWRILARAVAGADRFGVGRSHAITRQNVVARLVVPRFFVMGDEGEVAILVRNLLDEETEFTVKLEAKGLEVDAAESRIRIPAGAEVRVDRRFKAVTVGPATLTAHALSTVESDAMEKTIPVKPRGVRVTAAASGRVDGSWTAELSVPEGVDLTTAKSEVVVGTPTQAIRDALPWLAGFPYGCVEQTMSRFLPTLVAKGAMDRIGVKDETLAATLPDMVAAGLARLYRFQHDDGGWGWWEDDETDEFMTAYVVHGLALAKQAGFEVDGPTLELGLQALSEMKPTPFSVLVRHLAGDETTAEVEIEPEGDAACALLVLAGRKDLAKKIRGDTDGVEETAVVLRALHAVDPKDDRIPDLVERLLGARRGGAWETTIQSAHAVYALAAIAVPGGVAEYDLKVNDGRGGLRAGRNRFIVTRKGPGILFASAKLTWFSPEPPKGDGKLALKRRFERIVMQGDQDGTWPDLEPIESGATVRVGDEIFVTLTLTAQESLEYLLIESPIASGTEPWPDREDDFDWASRIEYRDDRVAVAESAVQGERVFSFRMKATHPGTFFIVPAKAWPMYAPGTQAFSAGFVLRVVR